jgi:hypothetical protein
MDLEERTLDKAQDRCEECGAPLTADEIAAALERGGPSLCTVHALETEPAEEMGELGEPGA